MSHEPLPRYLPISDYALLSDCHSAALVSSHGSIDWACPHRFDAPAAFARILDADRGGYAVLRPTGAAPAGRRYRGRTMVLESDHRAGRSLGRTTDFFSISGQSHAEDAGEVHPHHQLIRIAEAIEGETEWEFVCSPRFEYGVVIPGVHVRDDHLAVLMGGPEAMTVNSSERLEGSQNEVSARFTLREGESAWFVMTRQRPHDLHDEKVSDNDVRHRLEATVSFWEGWAALCTYDGPYEEEVIRSGLTLKALTNAPTGAIVAAPTTSLPEEIGGVRNWDYRFCWVRDATFTLYVLMSLGHTSEAEAFIGWLTRTTAGRPQDLQVLYGIGGERLLPESELAHLEGYRGSQPVRIGNGAANQFQLDIYGEVLDSAHLWRKFGGEISPELWAFLEGCVREIAEHWREPDDGIWEVRGGPRHFVYSKAMCWVGVDRAVKAAEALGLDAPLDDWRGLRDEIHVDVCANGYDEELGSFVQSYGSKALDASALLLPLIGFLPPTDPRVSSTARAIESELSSDGLVRRYKSEDGLAGDEGAFLICSFWLVDNLAMIGRRDDATALFDKLKSFANDVGLLSEELDLGTGELLGNFPQAFTHLALINSAFNLSPRTSTAADGDRPGIVSASPSA